MNSTYAIVDSKTAIIECASIVGLVQVPTNQRNPDITTSFGIGEVMIDALNKGCTSFIIGLGGSATNDGGLGMLLALGMKAWDKHENVVGPFGKDIHNVRKVSFSDIDSRLMESTIKVACDVDNPHCGIKGATNIYGSQKGATKNQIHEYDKALNVYADTIESVIGKSIKNDPGAGAAGGIGFALLSIGGTLVSGAELLAHAMKIEDEIQDADLVITGEGQSDEQTLYGKAPGYIAELAGKYNVPTVLISGSVIGDVDALGERFAGCFSIINQPLPLDKCIEQADVMLYQQIKQVIKLMGPNLVNID
ncbi:glycerate kinase [Virgibacillus necropolis]|uniref:glycerate kinase family protein n=1 Tax=Virgibacillus necropolis TaxID=163877 RepID=UPI00384F5FEE